RRARRNTRSVLRQLPIGLGQAHFAQPIFTTLSSYQRLVLADNGMYEPLHIHIQRHLEYSPHSVTTPQQARAANFPRVKSPSAFSPPSGKFEDLFPIMLQKWGEAIQKGTLRDYRTNNPQRIARLTVIDERKGHLELTILEKDED